MFGGPTGARPAVEQIGKWRWRLREGWITRLLQNESDPNMGPFPLQGSLTLVLRWSAGELDFKRSAPRP